MSRHVPFKIALCATLLGPVACACLAAAPTRTGEAQRRLPFCAQVEVDAAGKIQPGKVRGVPEALHGTVQARLSALKLQPARSNGESVFTRSQLAGDVVLTPAPNDAYQVGIDSLRVEPCALSQPAPRFPPSMAREARTGSVLLQLQIGADGQVVSAQALQSTRREFSEAALQAARLWTFEPQLLRGQAVAVEVQWPVRFRFENCSTPTECTPAMPVPVAFQCKWDEQMPQVIGQASCAKPVEVRGSRIRRGSSGSISLP